MFDIENLEQVSLYTLDCIAERITKNIMVYEELIESSREAFKKSEELFIEENESNIRNIQKMKNELEMINKRLKFEGYTYPEKLISYKIVNELKVAKKKYDTNKLNVVIRLEKKVKMLKDANITATEDLILYSQDKTEFHIEVITEKNLGGINYEISADNNSCLILEISNEN